VNGKVKSYRECQIFACNQKRPSLPLVPIKFESHFKRWGLDFISEIHPASSAQHKWILTATDYFFQMGVMGFFLTRILLNTQQNLSRISVVILDRKGVDSL